MECFIFTYKVEFVPLSLTTLVLNFDKKTVVMLDMIPYLVFPGEIPLVDSDGLSHINDDSIKGNAVTVHIPKI